MHRASFASAALILAVGVAYFSASASMQVPRRGRLQVQVVNGREAVAGEALVRFRRPVPAADLTALATQADSDVVERIGGTGLLRMRSRSLDAAALVRLVSRRGDVLYAEPNYVLRAFDVPNDPSFPQLWGLEDVGQAVNGGLPGTPGSDIRAVAAWDVTHGSTAHVVAVLDTGIDYTHLDLSPNIWSAPAAFTANLGGRTVHCPAGTHGFDAVARTCDPMDDNAHGTHVAGTIGAAGNDGQGVVGVNWTARIMGIKFLDQNGAGTTADAIDGIRFAVAAKRAFPNGANVRVLSASWGGTAFSQALRDEIDALNAEEMLFVAAAGNSAFDNDIIPVYPAGYDAPNIVAVAATGNDDQLAWFSNYGLASVHLGAPGLDILSTIPANGYMFASGTSMAAPHVSGAAALVLSRCTLDTAGLKDALIGSVQPMNALEPRTITGGRLDVHSAIYSCIAPPPTPDNLRGLSADAEVRLSWASSLGATAYTVKRSLAAGGPYATIASNVKGARYRDTGVSNGTTYHYVVSASNPLGESGDSDEASATPNRPSDLVVSSLTTPGPAAAGATIPVSVMTLNQGIGPAASTITRLYLSANSVLDAGDLAFDPPHAVPLLQPGASNSAVLTVTIPADTPAGVRYLIAVADAEGDAIESSESNNTRVRSVSIGPDLTLTDVTVPSTAAPGETITIWDTVRNQGGGGAAPSATTFYLSVNSALDASDTALSGTRTVPALEPGVTSAGASVVNIPTVITVGQYYVIAKADGGGAVAESSETNNTSARSIRIGADLTVSALAAPATSGAGLSIQISDTTRNEGTTAADTSVTRIFLSTNSQLDAADVEVGARTVPGLAPGANSSAAMTVTIPSGTATGTYYLLAVADADGAVSETNETNNRYARSLQLGGDLRVTVVTAPASASPGSSIIVSDTTTNQGGGAAAPTTTLYYFSANITLDTLDVSLGGRAVPALAPSATHSGSTTVTVPAGVAPGTYYILAKADGQNVEAETQETNNISARAIQVGGDLAVSALSVPAIGGAGLTIVVTDTTVNQGTAPVAASATRFYLSSNGSLDGSDLALPPGRTIPDLPVGASSSGSTTLTIPAATATGTYYVIAKADGDGNVGETLETNNTSARVLQIGPDLAVSALSLPDEIAPGATFGANATTVNQGGGAAPSSATSFFLSANYSLDSDDVALLPTLVVGALASGATSSATAGLTIPGGTAPGTYYVIAKADADGGTVETSESNNTRTRSTRVGPDLSVSSTSLSSTTVRAGGTATVTDTVVNQGAGVAAASTLRFYLSANITFDAADVVLPGSRTVPGLATDATSSGSTVITIPLATASGTYYVITKIDADGTVPECTETNNTRVVRSIQVTMPE